MITFGPAETTEELQQIIELQAQNLPHCLDEQQKKEQGFVTVQHSLELLQLMNSPYAHTIAKADDKVVGFALTMQKSFADAIPVLVPMFRLIDRLEFNKKPLKDVNYVVMGQICIHKDYRGQGIFGGLYQNMEERLEAHFELMITEIATRNTRSMRAHQKVGFEPLLRYQTSTEEWQIVLWDWRSDSNLKH